MLDRLYYNSNIYDEYIYVCDLYRENIDPKDEENINIIDAIIKGLEGENKIEDILLELPFENIIIRDAAFALDSGAKAQIDYILISRHMVYVIEVKNWSTYILFDRTGQVSARKLNNFEMIQCFDQNRYHVDVCKAFMPEQYHSLFYDLCVFCRPEQKIYLEYGNTINDHIARYDDLADKMMRIEQQAEYTMNDVEFLGIYELLNINKQKSYYSNIPSLSQMEYAVDVFNNTGRPLPRKLDKVLFSQYLTEYEKSKKKM